MTHPHPIWQRAQRTWPGLAQFDLPPDADRFIARHFRRVREIAEHDVADLLHEMWGERGADRVRTRALLKRLIPQLREVRAIQRALFEAAAARVPLAAE